MSRKQKLLLTALIFTSAAAIVIIAALMVVRTRYNEEEKFDQEMLDQFVFYCAGNPESINVDVIEKYTGLLSIDFEALNNANPDTVGWIHLPETKINYPVVQTTNNTLYLTKRFDHLDTGYGTIYADCRLDVTTANNFILYGHNTSRQTLTRFASLVNYLEDPDYVIEHPYFEFYDAATGECKAFDVFSVMYADISTDDSKADYYGTKYDEDMGGYKDFLVAKSFYEIDVKPTDGQVMLLSTCVSGYPNMRYIIACTERIYPIIISDKKETPS